LNNNNNNNNNNNYNYNKCIVIISDTSLRVQFPRKFCIRFWVGSGEEFPHFSRRALDILLPSATPYLCETGPQQRQPSKQSIILC
jgi:hypothetical protein